MNRMHEGCEPVDHNARANEIRKRMDRASYIVRSDWDRDVRRAVRRRWVTKLIWTAIVGYSAFALIHLFLESSHIFSN